MAVTTDPRTHVTPDAFKLSQEILGLPLAGAGRRLAALALDGVLIGIVSQLSWQILGVLAGVAFFRGATRRSKDVTRVGRAFQLSLGCLGAVILLVTIVVSTGALQRMLTRGAEELTPPGAPVSLGEAVAAGGAAIALRSVETEDEAVTLGMELAQLALRTSDADPDAALELVRARFPDDPEFDADAAMARIAAALDAESGPPEAAASAQATDSIPLDEAWTRMRALEAADSLDAEDERALTRLRARLGRELAADSLSVLNERLSDARDEASDLEDDLTAARRALREQEEEGGLFGWLLSTVDELGLTFGWGALYFASLTTLMKGQTPGKRALGIRVIRLDGQPIGWFHAFERAGGYAAGVATGLLGFAQILWDPNRQGIHDKIVGTVVVREGAPRAPGRWQGQA